jgi:hypothetical protein
MIDEYIVISVIFLLVKMCIIYIFPQLIEEMVWRLIRITI